MFSFGFCVFAGALTTLLAGVVCSKEQGTDERLTLAKEVEILKEQVELLMRKEESRANNVVAFTAYATSEYYFYDAGATVAFEATLLNEGNAYDTSTSTCTCPVTGIYMFSVTGYVRDERDYRMYLSHNGNQLVGYHGTEGAPVMSTNSVAIRCQAGDRVWVQIYDGDIGELYGFQDGMRTLTFTGALLQLL